MRGETSPTALYHQIYSITNQILFIPSSTFSLLISSFFLLISLPVIFPTTLSLSLSLSLKPFTSPSFTHTHSIFIFPSHKSFLQQEAHKLRERIVKKFCSICGKNMALNGLDDQLDLLTDGFLDNIEELLDFPNEDDQAIGTGTVNSIDGEALGMPFEPVHAAVSASKGDGTNFGSKYCDDDINNITDDWITKFLVEANFDIDLPPANDYTINNDGNADFPANDYIIVDNKKDESNFQSLSPVSVLEHNNAVSSSLPSYLPSSSEIVSLAPVCPAKPPLPAQTCSKRSRSQLSRRATQTLTTVIPLLPECESFEESFPRKKRMKKTIDPNEDNTDTYSAAVRKCMHCEVKKTPQWRAGPMGLKTLCNACGVRYKSGRLFPEYRPAASPTFVSSIHSNSHKRVVEMRNKGSQKKSGGDLLEYIRGATRV